MLFMELNGKFSELTSLKLNKKMMRIDKTNFGFSITMLLYKLENVTVIRYSLKEDNLKLLIFTQF